MGLKIKRQFIAGCYFNLVKPLLCKFIINYIIVSYSMDIYNFYLWNRLY